MAELQFYWNLASIDPKVRLEAGKGLIESLQKHLNDETSVANAFQSSSESCDQDIAYALKRLLRGLSSSRDGARQGFSMALAELLSLLKIVPTKTMIDSMVELTEIKNGSSTVEQREVMLGRLFGYLAIVQSQALLRPLPLTTAADILSICSSLVDLVNSKAYLAEAATTVCLSVFKQAAVSPHAENVLSSIIEAVVSAEDSICSPHQLLFVVEAQRIASEGTDDAWKKALSGWKRQDVLHRKNLTEVVQILKSTTECHPRIHSVWHSVLSAIIQGDLGSKNISFDLLWNALDEIMFNTTPDRKFIGFDVFLDALQLLPEQQIPLAFTPCLMRSLMNNLSYKDNYLHKQAKKTVVALADLARQKPSMALPLLMQILGQHGSLRFDAITKTNTVDSILASLDAQGVRNYLEYLKNAFADPSMLRRGPMADSKQDGEQDVSGTESLRRWVVDQMCLLIKTPRINKAQDWVQEICDFVVICGFFKVVKTDKHRAAVDQAFQPSDDFRRYCRDKLLSLVVALRSMCLSDDEGKVVTKPRLRLDGSCWTAFIVARIQMLHSDTKYLVPVIEFESETKSFITNGIQKLESIRKANTESQTDRTTDAPSASAQMDAFEQLFVHMLLNVYYEPADSIPLLQELSKCYDDMFAVKSKVSKTKSHKQKKRSLESTTNAESTESDIQNPIEVVMDILISFLAKPSLLLRSLASDVFKTFCHSLTPRALELVFEVLAARSGVQGANELFEGDDGSEEGEDDDSDNGSSSDCSSDDDESDDEDEMDADEELRLKVEEALGNAAVKPVDDGDDAMGDEEMLEFDDKLAEIFKQRKELKNQKKETKQSVSHFKLRVLDLLEIMIKTIPTSALIIKMVVPLLKLARFSAGSRDEKVIHDRVVAIVNNKLCKMKDVPTGVDSSDVLSCLKCAHLTAAKVGDAGLSQMCSNVSIMLVKIYNHLDDSSKDAETGSEETKQASKKRKVAKPDGEQEKSSVIEQQYTNPVSELYYAKLIDFVTQKNKRLRINMFNDLATRYPKYIRALVPRIVDYMQKNIEQIKTFPLVQTFDLIAVTMKFDQTDIQTWTSQTNEISAMSSDTLCGMISVLFQTMMKSFVSTRPNEGPFSVTKERVKQVLKSILTMIRRTSKPNKNTTEGSQGGVELWAASDCVDSVKAIAECEKFKSASSIRNLCVQIAKALNRDI